MSNSLIPFLTSINPKKFLLIDGIGAVVSAFFLGVVLVQLENVIGMPKNVLYGLALAPCIFAMYSFGCYFFLKRNWSPYLKAIALCNLIYCGVTIGLMYYYFDKLSTLGLFYFIMEIIIILVLVRVELRSSSKSA